MGVFSAGPCPVCNNIEFEPFLTCNDFFVSNEKFEIKQCSSCGFKITFNIANEDNIGKYYQSQNYISHSNTEKGLVNRMYHLVRSFMLHVKCKHVERATGLKTGHILDIGTGTGFFLNEMNRKGWKVTGTEKSEDARLFSSKKFNLEVLPSESLFDLEAERFDVVTLWHVLEHIHKIDDNLKKFRTILKPKGKLIIAVPNHTSYDARHYKSYWAAYDVPRHIWHFSPGQMKMFAQKHGFTLKSIHPMYFDSFYVSLLSEKYKKSSAAFLKGIFIGKISFLISLFNKERCSSVIYILEK